MVLMRQIVLCVEMIHSDVTWDCVLRNLSVVILILTVLMPVMRCIAPKQTAQRNILTLQNLFTATTPQLVLKKVSYVMVKTIALTLVMSRIVTRSEVCLPK
uniref:Uncharacterized protein n=1 Tax=Cacopsylla melanoneura TaxID=428564 RepID=A0A8D8SDJ2_9HEMI